MDEKQTCIGDPFQIDGVWQWCNWFERNPIGYKFTLGSDEFTKIAYNRAVSLGKFWWYLFNTGELAPASENWADGLGEQNPEDERLLRYSLYYLHDCDGDEKEWSTAEMTCKKCGINFLRDSAQEIVSKQNKYFKHQVVKLEILGLGL